MTCRCFHCQIANDEDASSSTPTDDMLAAVQCIFPNDRAARCLQVRASSRMRRAATCRFSQAISRASLPATLPPCRPVCLRAPQFLTLVIRLSRLLDVGSASAMFGSKMRGNTSFAAIVAAALSSRLPTDMEAMRTPVLGHDFSPFGDAAVNGGAAAAATPGPADAAGACRGFWVCVCTVTVRRGRAGVAWPCSWHSEVHGEGKQDPEQPIQAENDGYGAAVAVLLSVGRLVAGVLLSVPPSLPLSPSPSYSITLCCRCRRCGAAGLPPGGRDRALSEASTKSGSSAKSKRRQVSDGGILMLLCLLSIITAPAPRFLA